MANLEGAKRMARVGKFLVIAGFGSVLLFGVLTIVSQRIPLDAPISWTALNVSGEVLLVLSGMAPIVLGAILWLVGWVVEGFLNPPRPDVSRP